MDHYKEIVTTGLLGFVIGIGQVLKDRTPFSWRVAFGQALCAGGLGVASGTLFIFYPDLDPRAFIGAACVFATLGANFLSNLIMKTSKPQ